MVSQRAKRGAQTRSSCPARLQVLVVGWGQQGFMEALLHELDRGDQSLPVGSEVIFFNMHDKAATMEPATKKIGVRCIHVRHAQVRRL